MSDDPDWDDPYDGYDDDFCDCAEYDVDTLVGRARCYQCGRTWWLTDEQLSRELQWQASMMECAQAEEEAKAP